MTATKKSHKESGEKKFMSGKKCVNIEVYKAATLCNSIVRKSLIQAHLEDLEESKRQNYFYGRMHVANAFRKFGHVFVKGVSLLTTYMLFVHRVNILG